MGKIEQIGDFVHGDPPFCQINIISSSISHFRLLVKSKRGFFRKTRVCLSKKFTPRCEANFFDPPWRGSPRQGGKGIAEGNARAFCRRQYACAALVELTRSVNSDSNRQRNFPHEVSLESSRTFKKIYIMRFYDSQTRFLWKTAFVWIAHAYWNLWVHSWFFHSCPKVLKGVWGKLFQKCLIVKRDTTFEKWIATIVLLLKLVDTLQHTKGILLCGEAVSLLQYKIRSRTKEIAENICCVKGKMNGLRRPWHIICFLLCCK